MKNFQQNLLLLLASALCGLCAWQWYGQTRQRAELERLTQVVFEKTTAIRDYSNSIATMTHQITQMDAAIVALKQSAKTNEQVLAAQKREITRLQMANEGFTNAIAQYRTGVEALETRLKEAYDGIKQQNESLKELAAQRDEFIKKYNDEVKDRNAIVGKYNDLAAQVEKLQTNGAKP
jgi:chromosome segregation ATPase